MSDSQTDSSEQQFVGNQQAFRGNDPRRKSPILAAMLSFIPGLGQIYVGYYQRGFTHILVMGSVFSIVTTVGDEFALFPLAIMFIVFFLFYNVIDAYRRATLYNLSLDGIAQIELPDDFTAFDLGGSYIGGVAITVFGLVTLSNTAFDFSLIWLEDWWPLAPVALGVYLTFRAYQDSQTKTLEDSE